ncbi:n-sulphoglucosamine sulphohydrolase [Caerostris extrusa]|uniref:N-sulphoglucosamine sulphohydrolase n=1 Tax=Caerostris extrusa TaxID=172846 RepID=A0AAV4SPR4_CAEEX|nr:n-sulphoglucosamine sulphohydrolase [Caerostris extrusa]
MNFFSTLNHSQPFFLYVAFHDPHRCGHTNPEYGEFCEKFGNGEEGMGIIPDWKPEHYKPEDVIVPYFIPDTPTARADIAAQYTTLSRLDQVEEQIFMILEWRNLFLMHLPQQTYSQVSEEMVSLLDIVPTVLEWFNVKYPDYKLNGMPVQLSGKSLLQSASLKKSEAVFASHNLHEVTIFFISPTFQDLLNRTVEKKKETHWYKNLTDYYYRPEWELFDLEKDSNERHNVVNNAAYHSIRATLQKMLLDWQISTNDPWICSPSGVLENKGRFKENPLHAFHFIMEFDIIHIQISI